MVLKDTSIFGRSSANNPVMPTSSNAKNFLFGNSSSYSPVLGQNAGGVGTHTAYETDAYGNRIEVTYDATGKIVGSQKMKRNADGSYVTPVNGAAANGGVPMNASNWQKLMDLLRSKFGISL